MINSFLFTSMLSVLYVKGKCTNDEASYFGASESLIDIPSTSSYMLLLKS